ncbi:MAG: CPBP family intramembrane glutamic endopeptidase [Patescibacteria group bacterium]
MGISDDRKKNENCRNPSLLGNFLSYLRHPEYVTQVSDIAMYKKIVQIFKLWSFIIVVVFILGVLFSMLMNFLGVEEIKSSVMDMFLDQPLYVFLFLAIVWAPVVEEFTFRLGLLYSPFRLSFSAAFLMIIVFSLLFKFTDIYSLPFFPEGLVDFVQDKGLYLYIFSVLSLGSIFGFVLRRKTDFNVVQKFYTKNFTKIFYCSAILFAILHLLNFNNSGNFWFLLPLLIVPQFLVGLVLAYIRMKYGIIWSVFGHFLHNGVISLPLIYLSLLPISLSEMSAGKEIDMEKVSSEMTWQASMLSFLFLFIVMLVFVSFVKLIMEYKREKRLRSFDFRP